MAAVQPLDGAGPVRLRNTYLQDSIFYGDVLVLTVMVENASTQWIGGNHFNQNFKKLIGNYAYAFAA